MVVRHRRRLCAIKWVTLPPSLREQLANSIRIDPNQQIAPGYSSWAKLLHMPKEVPAPSEERFITPERSRVQRTGGQADVGDALGQ
jgi:hypothetical protein